MANLADTVAKIEAARNASENNWENAEATATNAAARLAFAENGAECLAHYDAAIEALNEAYDGYLGAAENNLESAKRLEADGGDCGDATRALAALDSLRQAEVAS